MRPTWIVMGLVVGLGAVAYVKLREKASGTPLARLPDGPSKPADGAAAAHAIPAGSQAPAPAPAPTPGGAPSTPQASAVPPLASPSAVGAATPAGSEEETRAAALRAQILEKGRLGDATGAAALEKQLDEQYGDTEEARRHAFERGLADARTALKDDRPVEARLPAADRARRDLSRGLFLREMFDAQGHPTEGRRQAVQAIASLNAIVMTASQGVPGVTRLYQVKQGDSPVRIVSREKLPYGPNALLFWNQGGNLDPSRLQAGRAILLPVETLEARVSLDRHLLGLYLGGSLVKEFGVGVGKPATPTYPGTYEVKDKYRNPDWHVPPQVQLPGSPRVIPYGDPRNELGSAWIPIASPEHPTGYGIHGTNKPETVGTECSNGCVRLHDAEAVEIMDWVRTGRNDGPATHVVVR